MMWGPSKFVRALRGRSDAHHILIEWGEKVRDQNRPLVWLHAASVGETLQAMVVLEALRERTSGLQVVFTFFSPSTEDLAETFPSDISAYLPWDLPEVIGKVIDALNPDLLALSQKEVWPSLVVEAGERGVPVVLMAATLPDNSKRLTKLGKLFLGPAFRSLARVAAISDTDADRFKLFGIPQDRIVVTGDPAVDSAFERIISLDTESPHLNLFRDEVMSVFVAGSIWSPDGDILIPALSRIRRSWPDLKIVLVPHEPSRWDFKNLYMRLDIEGWSPMILKDEKDYDKLGSVNAVLVNRVGILADLYTVASIAYVGGGFHGHGLHSVLEPAAAGVPVLFGPRHQNSLAASDLLACGGARMVVDVDSVFTLIEEWMNDRNKIQRSGRQAKDYIESHRGAAERTANLLAGHCKS